METTPAEVQKQIEYWIKEIDVAEKALAYAVNQLEVWSDR